MSSENLNLEEITNERRKGIAETIKTIGAEELKKLGETIFPFHDHPWREAYFTFIKENAGATFYYATTKDHIHFIYCHEKEKGIWFLPGSGKGPLQQTGLKIFKEIVEGGH